uniref:Transmembrane protein 230 n=1 Tax=Glossina austeni TaxID=7395 RepID=A0A1A9UJA4_GLOAU
MGHKMWLYAFHANFQTYFTTIQKRGYNKYNEDTTSRDSDSLIQEYGNISTDEVSTYCWRHPKVRENWRTVLAAVTLLLVGTGLFVMGTFAVADPANTSQGVVFFVAGLICFIPGAYHVVYIWLAAKGYRGNLKTNPVKLMRTYQQLEEEEFAIFIEQFLSNHLSELGYENNI